MGARENRRRRARARRTMQHDKFDPMVHRMITHRHLFGWDHLVPWVARSRRRQQKRRLKPLQAVLNLVGQLHGFNIDAARVPAPYVRTHRNKDGTYRLAKLSDFTETAIYSTITI